jgi:hypothetical protein
MPAGLLLKQQTSNELGLIMRYFEMRRESSILTKAEHGVVKADKRLQSYLTHHEIVRAKAEMDKENKAGHEAAINVHRLVINDFVSIRVLEKLAKETADEIDRLHHEIERGKAGMPKDTFEQFQRAEISFKEGETKEIRHLLQSARRIIDGLMKKSEGKVDIAYLVKRHFFIDLRLLNYLKLRFEARHEKVYLDRIKRTIQEIRKEIALIEHKRKTAKKSEQLVKSLAQLLKLTKEAIEEAFKIFINSTLLLDKVIGIIQGQVREDDELVQKHQIPLKMGQDDKTVKQSLLNFIQMSLKDMNTARLQLQI